MASSTSSASVEAQPSVFIEWLHEDDMATLTKAILHPEPGDELDRLRALWDYEEKKS